MVREVDAGSAFFLLPSAFRLYPPGGAKGARPGCALHEKGAPGADCAKRALKFSAENPAA